MQPEIKIIYLFNITDHITNSISHSETNEIIPKHKNVKNIIIL